MKTTRKPGPASKHLKELKELQYLQAKVGWFENAKELDGTPSAYVATIAEYGDPSHNIPARPHWKPTSDQYRATWKENIKKGVRALLRGYGSAYKLADGIGSEVEGKWGETILSIQEPPLAEVTIANRLKKLNDGKTVGSLTKPLIETGAMFDSLTHTVERKK